MTAQTSSPTRPNKTPHNRAAVIAITAAGAVLGAASLAPTQPALVWNFSKSLPTGLYSITRSPPAKGDLVVLAPAGHTRETLFAFAALREDRLLIKQLAAIAGDRVCRAANLVTINGAPAAIAKAHADGAQPLPAWSGCRDLRRSDVLVLAPHPSSFDSRYFGPIDKGQIIGIAHPVLTFPSVPSAQETP